MKTIYLIHGWDGSSKGDWLGWATEAFTNKGYKVITPDMPNTKHPKIDEWVNHLKSLVINPDQNTYFIGHSIGCQAIMRYLETIDNKVGGAIFVAGWFNLINLENKESEDIAKPWIETPINTDKVKHNLGHSVVILGDKDPWVPLEETKKAFETKLGSDVIVLSGVGHITSDDGFGPFPKLIEVFENVFSKTAQPTRQALDLATALRKRNIELETEHYDGHKHVDIYIPSAKLNIEIDGLQHYTEPSQIIADFKREYYSDKEGFSTFHITNQLIETHLNQIADAIDEVVRKTVI
jgi:predicted alpha/beta hydrolase family esterase/very-short-patch-repair endonuclease